MARQRILVYGAGVIGSFYAARLLSKHDITLLARGRRLADLREKGLALRNESTGEEERHTVAAIDRLEPGDCYDYILVAMRCQQAEDILPALQANCSPNVVFMMNGVTSYDRWHAALGGRMLSGFPTVGGEVKDGVVRYAGGLNKSRRWPETYLGTPDGSGNPALATLIAAFAECGLPVRVLRPMRDFNYMHAALVCPIANALYRCHGSNYELARDREGLRLMVMAVKEGFRALRARGIRMVPGKLRVLELMPVWGALPWLARLFATPHIETVAARHARNARDEMGRLSRELLEFCEGSGVPMPAARRLAEYNG